MRMGWWRTFLDSLDSPGGHIIVLVFLLCAGIGLVVKGVMEGSTVVGGSFGALLVVLKDAKSNKDQTTS